LLARDRTDAQAGEQVSGVRSEPVEVWLIDGRPARFVWRERLYAVLSILERPSEQPAAHALADHGEERDQADEPLPAWLCWKLTASVGRHVPASLFRLCQDAATSRWTLTRIGR
jgi:hypothetical protein